MNDIFTRLDRLGINIPEILLPRSADLKKWAVIACDQFTQDRRYWEKVRDETGNAPSTLNLILPEIYLNDSGMKHAIHPAMRMYLDSGIFASRKYAVYTERSISGGRKRKGLVLAVDLEKYDWRPNQRPLIRATEGTVADRLPPRIDIRRGAPLETSHILLLIDDEDNALIPAIGKEAMKHQPLYSTELMMNSGSVTGWAVDSHETIDLLARGLLDLAERANNRYGVKDSVPFLYAAGDGNHSLAAAKAVWEEYKKAHSKDICKDGQTAYNPLRYALVELENLHDPAISFEPIHRVIFGAKQTELMEILSASKEIVCRPRNKNVITVENNAGIVTAVLEPLLEEFTVRKNISRNGSSGSICSIDYIHGEDEVIRLMADTDRQAVGLILPPIRKDGFFKTIAQTGPLPRKSFSMGESEEKRFYMECRRLIG